MKAFPLALCALALSSSAFSRSGDVLQIYECRYEGIDSAGHRILEVGHVVTSEIDGVFETRTLGMQRSDGPSAQVYVWEQGGGRKLYASLVDDLDTSHWNAQLIEVGAAEARAFLRAAGADVSLTCRML